MTREPPPLEPGDDTILDVADVSRLVIDHLQAHVPGRLAVLERLRGPVEDNAPVVPVLYHWTQLPVGEVGIEQWPFVLVVGQNTLSSVPQGATEAGGERFLTTHTLAVFVWMRGDSWTVVASGRYRLGQAVMDVLRQHNQIVPGVRIDMSSVQAQWSAVGFDENLGRTIGAGRVNFSVKVTENLAPGIATLGTLGDGSPEAIREGAFTLSHPSGVMPRP